MWRETPPPWQSHLPFGAHEFAVDAGWELTPEGNRRDLYCRRSYELILADEPELTPSTHAVTVSTQTVSSCGWCGRKLVALLDIDLQDSRSASIVAGLGIPEGIGTRLRIAYCRWCSYYETLYTDVDLWGNVSWSDSNEKTPRILEKIGFGNEDDVPSPASRRLVLGPERRTPYEAVGRFHLDETGISQIGGSPEWIQDATYPICPGCQRRMVNIGQVYWQDVEQFAEGSTYAFLCMPCGKAATIYQQT